MNNWKLNIWSYLYSQSIWERNRYSLLETTKSRAKSLSCAKTKPMNGQLTVVTWSPPLKGTGGFTAEVSVRSIRLSVPQLRNKNFKQATQDGLAPSTISISESPGSPTPLPQQQTPPAGEAQLLGHSAGSARCSTLSLFLFPWALLSVFWSKLKIVSKENNYKIAP